MDRVTWLKEMQRECEEKYDGYAPLYWDEYGLYSNITHLHFIQEFLSRLPQPSSILDAACGAGRYLPFLLEKGHSILGIDQSQGMLMRAREKFSTVPLKKVSLQEMAYQEAFDVVICVDAMENIPPEDWLLVLCNFHRALKPHGYLYFTVETIDNTDKNEIKQAFEKAQQSGLPVVFGEKPDEEVYHYHPMNQQVIEWVERAGFEIIKEYKGEIWYYHILVQKVLNH